jgi:hypothetical protein
VAIHSDTARFSSNPDVTRFWKLVLLVSGFLSAGTALVEIEGFWSSYLFDIVFPAYLYIYLRGLFQGKHVHQWLRGISPSTVFGTLVGITFVMEMCQYFGLYKGHYDPIDLVAYVSLLGPCYIADRWFLKNQI